MVLAGLTPEDWQTSIVDENLRVPGNGSPTRPDLVGITAFTSQANRAYDIAPHFRALGVPVVMGGLHATMCQAILERYQGLPATNGAFPAFAFKVSPLKEGGLFAAAVAIVAFDYVVDGRRLKRDCSPCDSSTINRFDRGAVRWHNRVLGSLSYVMEVAAIITPGIVTIRDRGFSRELAEDLWVYLETFALSSALNITVKTLARRPVPLLYGEHYAELEKKPAGYRSFYSGHAAQMANALVANAVMSRLRGNKRAWPCALAAIGTLGVSVARVGSGRHFYSDVAAGALAGGLVGGLLPLLHPAELRNGDRTGPCLGLNLLARRWTLP